MVQYRALSDASAHGIYLCDAVWIARFTHEVRVADEATRIEQAAAALLCWLERQNGPWQDDRVPVDALVEAIGLDVARFPPALQPGTLGYLEPGEELIFLRSGLPEPVRRFTLAHELGHAALHRNDGMAARAAGTWVAAPATDRR